MEARSQPLDTPTFGLFPNLGSGSAKLQITEITTKLNCYRDLMVATLVVQYKPTSQPGERIAPDLINYYDLRMPRFSEQIGKLRVRDQDNRILFMADKISRVPPTQADDSKPIVTERLVSVNWSQNPKEHIELIVMLYHTLTPIGVDVSEADGRVSRYKGYGLFVPVWVSGLLEALADPKIDNKYFHQMRHQGVAWGFTIRLWGKVRGEGDNPLRIAECTHSLRAEEGASQTNPRFKFKKLNIRESKVAGDGALFRLVYYEKHSLCLKPAFDFEKRRPDLSFGDNTLDIDRGLRGIRALNISLNKVPATIKISGTTADLPIAKSYIFLISTFGWTDQQKFDEFKRSLLFAVKTIQLFEGETIFFAELRATPSYVFEIKPCNLTNSKVANPQGARVSEWISRGCVLSYEPVLPQVGTPAYMNRFKKLGDWLDQLRRYSPSPGAFEYMAVTENLKKYLKSVETTKDRPNDIFQHVILCIPGMKTVSFDQIQNQPAREMVGGNYTQARLYNHIAMHLLVCEPESESSLLGANIFVRSISRIVDRELPGIVLKCLKGDLILEQLVKMLSMINRGCIKYIFNPPLNQDKTTSAVYFASKYHYCSHGVMDNIKLIIGEEYKEIGEDYKENTLNFTVQVLTFDYQHRFRSVEDSTLLDIVERMVWQHDVSVTLSSISNEQWPSDLAGRMCHSAISNLLKVDGNNGTHGYFNIRDYYYAQALTGTWYGLCGIRPGGINTACVQVPLPPNQAFVGYDLDALKATFSSRFLFKTHPCLLEPNPDTLRCIQAWNVPWQDQRVKNYFNSSTILSKQFIGSVLASYFPALYGVQFTDKPGQNMLRVLHSRTRQIENQPNDIIETGHYVFSFGFNKENPIMKSPVYARILDIFIKEFTEMSVFKPNSTFSYLGRLLGDSPDRMEFGFMLQALRSHGKRYTDLLKDIAMVMIEMRHVHFMEELDSFRTREVRGRMMKYLFPDEDRMDDSLRADRTQLYGKLDTKEPEELMALELAMILIRCLFQVRFGGANENREGAGDIRSSREELRNSFELAKKWLKQAAAVSRDGFAQSETLVPFGLCPNLQERSKPHLLINGAVVEVQHQNESYEEYLVKVQTAVRNKRLDDQKLFLSALLGKLQTPFLEFKKEVVVKFCDNLFRSFEEGQYTYGLKEADNETRLELDPA